MRIISDFKDYYDSAQSYGIDPAVIYDRMTTVVEVEEVTAYGSDSKRVKAADLAEVLRGVTELLLRLPSWIGKRKDKYQLEDLKIPITTKVIGFCGRFYPAVEVDGEIFYSTARMASTLSSDFMRRYHIDSNAVETLLADRARYFGWSRPALSHTSWEAAAKDIVSAHSEDVFLAIGIPVFKVEALEDPANHYRQTVMCTLNPQLRLEQFQQIKGPAEAFQEISMYLGNELARQGDPAPNVSDEILRDEKGFDEWSFRRHKEEDRKHLKNERKRGKPKAE